MYAEDGGYVRLLYVTTHIYISQIPGDSVIITMDNPKSVILEGSNIIAVYIYAAKFGCMLRYSVLS
jgi:hypothetical protein